MPPPQACSFVTSIFWNSWIHICLACLAESDAAATDSHETVSKACRVGCSLVKKIFGSTSDTTRLSWHSVKMMGDMCCWSLVQHQSVSECLHLRCPGQPQLQPPRAFNGLPRPVGAGVQKCGYLEDVSFVAQQRGESSFVRLGSNAWR